MVIRAMQLAWTEFEIRHASDWTRTALAEMRNRGLKLGGCATYGFRHVGNKSVADEAEQAVIATIHDLRSKGLTLRSIAEELWALGIRNRYDRKMSLKRVHAIVKRKAEATAIEEPATQQRKSKRTPSVGRIVTYWREQNAVIQPSWDKATNHCWRCGRVLRKAKSLRRYVESAEALHRAHIVARALEGPSEPSNFIILCRNCHVEAPDVPDPEHIWEWIRATIGQEYRQSRMMLNSLMCYERLYGQEPIPGILSECLPSSSAAKNACDADRFEAAGDQEGGGLFTTRFVSALCVVLNKVGTHSGSFSGATFAWACRQSVLFAEGKSSFLDTVAEQIKMADLTTENGLSEFIQASAKGE